MSSFVISKQEYIKAAGFFAGVAEQSRFAHEPLIYWWSENKKRVLTAEDYYSAFSKLYEMNAKSVQLQYHDKTAESDPEEYSADFEEMRKKAAKLVSFARYGTAYPLQTACFNFHTFARSVNYQIEDPLLAKAANIFLHKCESMLTGAMLSLDSRSESNECWGEFNLDV